MNVRTFGANNSEIVAVVDLFKNAVDQFYKRDQLEMTFDFNVSEPLKIHSSDAGTVSPQVVIIIFMEGIDYVTQDKIIEKIFEQCQNDPVFGTPNRVVFYRTYR